MDIKLKNRIKTFITNIWLIEIVILLVIGVIVFNDIKGGIENISNSVILKRLYIDSNPQAIFKDKFQEKVSDAYLNIVDNISQNNLDIGQESLKDNANNNLARIMYLQIDYYNNEEFYYILKNKKTKNIITNDLQYYNLAKDYNKILNIDNYISDKLGQKKIDVHYDKSQNFNPIEESYLSEKYTNVNLGEYEEYYYQNVDYYVKSFDYTEAYIYYFLILVGVILIIRIIVAIIYSKGKLNIKGNFIKTVVYIFKNGFKNSGSRIILILMFVITLISMLIYLYFLAGTTYDNNLLVKFFSRYPFKSLLLILSMPILCILFLTKKIVDVNCVNNNLKEINDGNVSVELTREGSREIRELVSNIEKIKDGYEIAIEEKMQNEKYKTELITNVSHDLRTPLTSIINYVNILQNKTLSQEERSEYLKILDQKSKKLKLLIDDLFEMSKLNSGKITLDKQEIDIISLIHQVIGEYSYMYEDRKLNFVIESTSEEINMLLDGKLMSRVVENIIINAIKYSMDNTRVYVEIQEDEECVIVSVKNIASYKMMFNNNNIFQRFVRGDASRNSNIEGSGLGLAITKSIIELHRGEVNIETEGDMFKIYIKLPKTRDC
ncbi:MAG: HAMP domain-containing sensor histidine kinase [Clostridium sp.]|nr:HAMP domain-containing sensor histidine kinase [Clostridium sp.]